MSEKSFFDPGEHYRHEYTVGNIEIGHSHWDNSSGTSGFDHDGVVSMMRVRTRGIANTSCDICFSPSVADLRAIAAALNEAANSMEAHQVELRGGAA